MRWYYFRDTIGYHSNTDLLKTPLISALSMFLAGHRVAMVTYCVTKILPTCSPVIGQFFDIIIVASIDKEWL